jgi:hypothetical protein
VRRRWQALSTADRIALIGLLVAVLGAVPGYLALRGTGDAKPSGTTVAPTTVAPDKRQALRLRARYNWTTPHIMWALPGQLSPEDSRLAQQRILFPESDPGRQAAATADLEALLARQGGVKIDFVDMPTGAMEDSELRLIITGQYHSPVLIEGMRARVLKRQPPMSETLFYGPPEGEGENIQIAFDLDSTDPVARKFVGYSSYGSLGKPYFDRKHITVKRGEQVVFSIRAFTNKFYCEWEIVIDAVVDGEPQAFTVKDGNRPFRTTAFANTYGIIYELDLVKGRFARLPPGSKREVHDGEVIVSRS